VVVGNTIKYDVKAHLVNVNAADFVLTYDPELLSVASVVEGTDFDGLPLEGDNAALVSQTSGALHFRGEKLGGTVSDDVTLFTVTFNATKAGTSALNFDETTDEFGMPAVGSSENVYAAALTDGSVTVLEALNVTAISLSESVDQTSWTPLYGNLVDGYTMVIDPENTFEYVDVTSLTANRPLADGTYPFYLSQTGLSDEFWAYWAAQGVTEGKTGWTIITGTAPIFTLVVSGSGTEFALMDGMYPLQLARVSGDYPTGAYNFTGTVNDTFGGKANAAVKITYVKAPTLDSTDIQGYYLTGDAQDFHVTVSNPSTGGTFGSTIDYIFTITGAVKADVTSLVCPSFAGTTNLIPLFTESGGNLTGSMTAIMKTIYPTFTGFPMTAGTDYVNTCTITFATAKSYPFTVSMVDQAVSPANLLATMTKTAIVYTKPVISSTTLAGPYQTNNDQDFSLSITNPSSIPGPFDLHFNFPAGTVLVYGGNTYPCDSTGCTVPVLLPAASNDLTFTVTLVAPFSGSVTVDLNDSDWIPADRLLATLTQTVVSLPNFTVTGTVSMQGRSTRAGVPMTLAGLFPVNTATSIEQISNNLIFSNVAEGTYTVSTNQPRYLNVAGISVEIKAGKVTLNRLELKGGNAKWTDNSIDILDAVLVGTTFGSTGSSYDGDVNFDGKVSIQDLALVGGNYGLTSAFAYVGVWVP
ncbi:MAG: cohesin domain-containing protein, partial [Anaerolineaceae bacterium]